VTPAIAGGHLPASYLAHVAILGLLLHPLFFIIFRMAIFDTLPRDNYAPYLLWLLNEPGGVAVGSPYGYRILSVLAAAPFYYLLPPITFTNLPADIALPYLRATAALSALSFVAVIAAAVLAYRLMIDRCALGRVEGVFAGVFVLAWNFYASVVGIDPVAILLVVLALYVIDRLALFALVVVASAFFNEKVAIVLVTWLSIRCILSSGDRTQFGRQWIAALAGLAVYAGMIALIRLPGHDEQFDLLVYGPTLLRNTVASFTTGRGIVLNLLPCALLAGLVCWSWWYLGRRRSMHFALTDLLVVPAMILVALVLTQFYQVGRIVAHAAPIFILPVAQAFGLWSRRGSLA
jgi:hypothetical protein